nr:autotransporter domain-containing protein [Rhodoplanes elegans]
MELAGVTAARADCTPAAASGVTAVCTGTTNNQGGGAPGTSAGFSGYGTGTETGLTIVVPAGSGNTLTGADFGVFAAGATLTVGSDAVVSGGQDGVFVTGRATVNNAGNILGTGGAASTGIRGDSLTVTNSGVIASAGGGILATGAATVVNSGRIAASGLGIQTGGTLDLVNTGSIIGWSGIITGGAATIVNAAGATIGGSGGAIMPGAGTSIYNSGTIFAATAIQFTGGGNTLTLAPGSTIYGNVIGGSGNTLRLGGASGTGSFDVSQLGSGATQTFQNFGTLSKIDGSTWTLTGTGSAFTGAVMVSGGLLAVDGDIHTASGVTVQSGGTLGGTGVLPSTVVEAGGVLAPGNSVGAITVAGTLTFGSGSIYRVELNTAGQSDKVVVTGAAALGGTLQLVGAAGTAAAQTTILSAASITGTFSAVTSTYAFLTPVLTYGAADVGLSLTRNAVAFARVARTPNQHAVATAFDASPATSPSANPAAARLVQAVVSLTEDQAREAYDQLSGEVHAATAGALIDESVQVRSSILGRLRQATAADMPGVRALSLGGPQTAQANVDAARSALAFAPPRDAASPPGAAVDRRGPVYWAQSYGSWGRFDGDGNGTALAHRTAGVLTGVDARLGVAGRFGFAAGYAGSRTSTSRGTADIDSGQIAAYGGWHAGALALRGGAVVAVHGIATDRDARFAGWSERIKASYQAGSAQAFGEVGYGLGFGPLAVEPFVGAAWVRWATTGFREAGGDAALWASANAVEVGYTTLGLRAATLIPLGATILVPRATVGWQHALGDVTPDLDLAFQATGAGFSVTRVPIARDALLAEAGVDVILSPAVSIGAAYAGQIGAAVKDHGVKGRFAWRF